MHNLTEQDLGALQRSAQCDPRTMEVIAQLSPQEAKAIAQASLQRRMAFVFDLLDNNTLIAISEGRLDMAQTCKAMLAQGSPRS